MLTGSPTLYVSNLVSYPQALDLIASGKVDVKPLMTHRFELQEAIKAFHVARDGTEGAIKVLINL